MSFTVVDASELVQAILVVMPDAIVIYRWVGTASDPNPRGEGGVFCTGQAWFDKLWGQESQGTGATYWQFVNEWENNEQPLVDYQRFGVFYRQLGNVCLPRGIVPTCGDFSSGTPPDANDATQGLLFAALDTMFQDAAARKIPINQHLYSAQGAGAFDMAPGSPFYFMRWEQIASRYPSIQIIAGEAGNYGDGGRVYDATLTPQCMRQAAKMLRASPYYGQFLGANWWGVVSEEAHPDWKGNDWSGAFTWFFNWSCNGQLA